MTRNKRKRRPLVEWRVMLVLTVLLALAFAVLVLLLGRPMVGLLLDLLLPF
jgi:Na+-driven multidrug efflux pump